MKRLILCADDYALTPDVGEGIRRLIAAGRLSAVSCMADSPLWPEEAEALKLLQDRVAVGLHFNLTHVFSGGAGRPSLGKLIRGSLLGRVDTGWVAAELNQQLERFEQGWGKRPDFIDGHQHVHVFPGIRRVVLAELIRRYPSNDRPWLRRVNPPLRGHDALIKALVLRLLAAGFEGAVQQFGLRLSGDFAGLYSLSPKTDFRRLMAGWLRAAPEGALLMCHPGVAGDSEGDEIACSRQREWRYLIGPEFAELCKAQKIILGK